MSRPHVNPEIFEQRLREIEARIDTVQNSTRHDDIAETLRQHFAEFRDVLKEAPPLEEIAKIWRHDVDEIRATLRDAVSTSVIAALEGQIRALGERQDERASVPADVAAVIKALTGRLEAARISVTGEGVLESLEQRIGALVEKLANFEPRSDRQDGADRRIDELLDQLRELRAQNESRLAAIQQQIATNVADAISNPAESIRRDVHSLKEIQTSVDRRTQDTFEAVYGTIEQVVDRLATIENELRDRHSNQLAGGEGREPGASATVAAAPALLPPAPPAADRAPPAPALEPPDEYDRAAMAPSNALLPQPSAKTARLRHVAVPGFDPDASPESGANARRVRIVAQAIDRIAASAPPPYPPPSSTLPSPASEGRLGWGAAEERKGAAEVAEPVRAKFVAAARRAAQTVVGEQRETPPAPSPPRVPSLSLLRLRGRVGWRSGERRERGKSGQHAARNFPLGAPFQRWRPRAKSVMLGVSMILLVLGAFGVALDSFRAPAGQQSVGAVIGVDDVGESDGELTRSEQPPPDQPPPRPGANLDERASPVPSRADALSDETMPAQAPPRSASPKMAAPPAIPNSPATQTPAAPSPYLSPQAAEGRERAASPTRNALLQGTAGGDGASQHTSSASADLTATPLPPTIGGKALLAAASAGDPGACYEIAMRFAQGRNTAQDLAMAAAWLERAARRGLAPAQFRLATLYEKGHGVQKDLAEARSLYVAAAAKGHAKAMHNLAVLYAGGINGQPDYALASQWFHRAAAHGVADSQYNLAILYARGLGVERNFAESYKWFALAAKGGDKDAARKRDEVAMRLDPKQLESAKLNAASFVAVPQPNEATAIKAPPGGWDQVAATATTKSKALVRPERFPGR